MSGCPRGSEDRAGARDAGDRRPTPGRWRALPLLLAGLLVRDELSRLLVTRLSVGALLATVTGGLGGLAILAAALAAGVLAGPARRPALPARSLAAGLGGLLVSGRRPLSALGVLDATALATTQRAVAAVSRAPFLGRRPPPLPPAGPLALRGRLRRPASLLGLGLTLPARRLLVAGRGSLLGLVPGLGASSSTTALLWVLPGLLVARSPGPGLCRPATLLLGPPGRSGLVALPDPVLAPPCLLGLSGLLGGGSLGRLLGRVTGLSLRLPTGLSLRLPTGVLLGLLAGVLLGWGLAGLLVGVLLELRPALLGPGGAGDVGLPGAVLPAGLVASSRLSGLASGLSSLAAPGFLPGSLLLLAAAAPSGLLCPLALLAGLVSPLVASSSGRTSLLISLGSLSIGVGVVVCHGPVRNGRNGPVVG